MKKIVFVIMIVTLAITTMACSSSETDGTDETELSWLNWENYERADMSGYAGLEDYDSELMYRDLTNTEVLGEMDKGSSFIVYYGFSNCPWCNHVVAPLNDVALDEGLEIAYVNTRKDPSWTNNLEIDNYEEFSERFKDYLALDEDGIPHLYAPAIYFIKDGKAVYNHDGTVPSQDDSSVPLTEEQVDEFKSEIKAGIKVMR